MRVPHAVWQAARLAKAEAEADADSKAFAGEGLSRVATPPTRATRDALRVLDPRKLFLPEKQRHRAQMARL